VDDDILEAGVIERHDTTFVPEKARSRKRSWRSAAQRYTSSRKLDWSYEQGMDWTGQFWICGKLPLLSTRSLSLC